jgi:hypothetical protein
LPVLQDLGDCIMIRSGQFAPHFATAADMLSYLEGCAGEITAATVAAGPQAMVTYKGVPLSAVPDVGMIVNLPDISILLPVALAEALLNDGLLNRHRIPVKLFRG